MSAAWTKRRIAKLVALALPLLGTAGLIVRGEIAVRGREWEFKIRGYDPRDLLRGHYLTYRIDWAVEEPEVECAQCCLCLERAEGRQSVTRRQCSDAGGCEARLTEDELPALERYYIPEERAAGLESAVRAERASVVLSSVGGRLALKDLRVDGKPWREALGTVE